MDNTVPLVLQIPQEHKEVVPVLQWEDKVGLLLTVLKVEDNTLVSMAVDNTGRKVGGRGTVHNWEVDMDKDKDNSVV